MLYRDEGADTQRRGRAEEAVAFAGPFAVRSQREQLLLDDRLERGAASKLHTHAAALELLSGAGRVES